MNLTAWMPFWNSLDAVRRLHSDLELAAIVFFLLLALFDAFAHWTKNKEKEHKFGAIGIVFFFIAVTCEFLGYAYGQRNDNLSERVIVSLSATAGQAVTDSHNALQDSGKAKIAADGAIAIADAANILSGTANDKAKSVEVRVASLDARIGKASSQVDALEARLAWRHIDPKKRTGYIARLKPFAGSVVLFDFAGESNPEAIGFANEVLTLLHDAGWLPRNQNNSFGSRTGMECFTSTSNDAGRAFAEVMGQLPSSKITPWNETSVAARIVFGLKAPP
jgi:hypothetical protein